MPHFFVDEEIESKEYSLFGEDGRHISKSLRMNKGESLTLCSPSGTVHNCVVEEISGDMVKVNVLSSKISEAEPDVKVTLYQALPKGDKMELIIQKAVELGVSEIVPVAMKNCVVKLDEKKAQSKCKRWQAIAESAAKQSKRTVIPQIQMPLSWKQALEEAKELEVVLVPYENERGMEATREIFRSIPEGASIGVMIGPEGGFSPEEIAQLDKDMHRISLGRRILRTETAGMATLSMLIYELDI